MSRNASADELYFATLTVAEGFAGAAYKYWYSSANVESPLKIIY
jgi:hypothetical protein